MNRLMIRALSVAAVLAAPSWVSAQAIRTYSTPPGAVVAPAASAAVSPANVLLVEQGTHKLHRANGDVARVAVGSADIADVSIVNRREVLVSGKQLGVTSLMLWIKGESAPREYRVRVGAVKDPLRTAQPDPELAGAIIDQGRGLEGRLPNLMAYRNANLAAQTPKAGQIADRSAVTLETQVMTEVRIAEVSRRTLQRYGLNIMRTGSTTSGGVFGPGSLGSSAQGVINGGSISGSLADAFGLVVTDATKNILGVLNILEGRGLSRTLAEPSLLAMSGQTATYLAGGEFPVPVSQGGATAGGISIEYKEFGVRLALTPTVLARNRIALKVAPEVSDLDFSAGIQIGGVAVPALTVRRTDTTVELGDGESFVISGLVSSTMANNVNKVPWLADVPVIGAFFKSISSQRDDKELIMVVTPRLVRPIGRDAQLPKLPGSEYDREGRPELLGKILFKDIGYDSGFSR